METTTFDLTQRYTITPDHTAQFHHNGHIRLRSVATAEEIDYFRPLIAEIVEEVARVQDMVVRLDDSCPLFIEVTNLWRMSDLLRDFICAERFARIAAELMGVNGVRLYHDQALIKETRGKPTPWHKDHYYWPLATRHTVKMWLALTDIHPEMGGMVYASGSHHHGSFPEVPISVESQDLFEDIIRRHHIPRVSYSLNAGDAVFHSGDVLHSTFGNTSAKRREVLTVIYYADGTRVMEQNHEHRLSDLKEFLPGLKGGDLAVTDLNPLLYEATP